VLSEKECDAAVQAAEAHAAAHGWSTARHAAYPSHDLPIDAQGTIGDPSLKAEPPQVGRSVTSAIESALIPELAERFGLERCALSVQDLFLAKCACATTPSYLPLQGPSLYRHARAPCLHPAGRQGPAAGCAVA
jgi:hypothetical protein